MYLTEAELESELNYFTECLAVDEEGYPCLYNEATEEYEYIEDEDIFELAEAVLNEKDSPPEPYAKGWHHSKLRRNVNELGARGFGAATGLITGPMAGAGLGYRGAVASIKRSKAKNPDNGWHKSRLRRYVNLAGGAGIGAVSGAAGGPLAGYMLGGKWHKNSVDRSMRDEALRKIDFDHAMEKFNKRKAKKKAKKSLKKKTSKK